MSKHRYKVTWRKIEKHLYCLHMHNGKETVAFYASWAAPAYPGSGGWRLKHKSAWIGADRSGEKLGAMAKRRLESIAIKHLGSAPEHWKQAEQIGEGCVVWCYQFGNTLKDLQNRTVLLHQDGLELIEIRPHESVGYWLVCRMR